MSLRLAWLLLAIVLVFGDFPGSAAVRGQAPPRIVAVADIHGSAAGLTQILRAAALIDAAGKWSGGTARLVQTGDFLDRGAGVRQVMDLLMRLEGEARRAGGRVDVLLGNHEGMNILHDLRDVSPEAYASFADSRSEDRRRRAFDAHAAIAKRQGDELDRAGWMTEHPLGYAEYVEALGPGGQYGRWIRNRKVILQIGDTLFMHAGLHPERAITVDEVNRTVELEVRKWDDLLAGFESARLATRLFTLRDIANVAQVEVGRVGLAQKTGEVLPEHVTQEHIARLKHLLAIDKWALIEADGPLWYRGLADMPDDQQPAVEALLKRHGARRIVIGHTPQRNGRIRARFSGAVVLLDTGMLSEIYKGGQPSALEIQGDKLTAIYVPGREPVDGLK